MLKSLGMVTAQNTLPKEQRSESARKAVGTMGEKE
jgi:hypothetical protein